MNAPIVGTLVSSETTCPCCRRAVDPQRVLLNYVTHELVRGGIAVQVTDAQFKILACIITATSRGGYAPVEDIIDALYIDRADGGSVRADEIVRVNLTHLTGKIAPLNLGIDNEWGRGWRLVNGAGRYRFGERI